MANRRKRSKSRRSYRGLRGSHTIEGIPEIGACPIVCKGEKGANWKFCLSACALETWAKVKGEPISKQAAKAKAKRKTKKR